jgi:hypothetical protein
MKGNKGNKGKTNLTEQSSLNNFYNINKKRTQNVNKEMEKINNSLKNSINQTSLTKEQVEQKLIEFDLNPMYGPCRGLTRSKRFDLAVQFGLNPPEEVKKFLNEYKLEKSYYDRFV